MSPLRPASTDDLPALVELERRCYTDPWTQGQWQRELAAPGAAVLVCPSPEGLAGVISMRRLPDAGEILNLAVDRAHRRRGLGRLLLEAGGRWLAAGGLQRVRLEVRPDNEPARCLYAAAGFVRVGRRPHYYADGSDAEVLEAPLPLAAGPRCTLSGLCYPAGPSTPA